MSISSDFLLTSSMNASQLSASDVLKTILGESEGPKRRLLESRGSTATARPIESACFWRHIRALLPIWAR